MSFVISCTRLFTSTRLNMINFYFSYIHKALLYVSRKDKYFYIDILFKNIICRMSSSETLLQRIKISTFAQELSLPRAKQRELVSSMPFAHGSHKVSLLKLVPEVCLVISLQGFPVLKLGLQGSWAPVLSHRIDHCPSKQRTQPYVPSGQTL